MSIDAQEKCSFFSQRASKKPKRINLATWLREICELEIHKKIKIMQFYKDMGVKAYPHWGP